MIPRIISPDTLRGSPKDRTPPGQSLTVKWPVLHYGQIPKVDPRNPDWSLRIFGQVDHEYELIYDEIRASSRHRCRLRYALRHALVSASITCSPAFPPAPSSSAPEPRPAAAYVMCHSEAGFTVNVPLKEFIADDCLLAYAWDGQELTAEHGGPLRGLVPRFYLWKTAKWIRGIELRTTDAPGFWEQNGYHMHGNPWAEERFGW